MAAISSRWMEASLLAPCSVLYHGRNPSGLATPALPLLDSRPPLAGPARRRQDMELFIFARFHARAGQEEGVAEALRDTVAPSREEPGCLNIHAFRSLRDP